MHALLSLKQESIYKVAASRRQAVGEHTPIGLRTIADFAMEPKVV